MLESGVSMDYPRKLVVPMVKLSESAQQTLDAAVEEFAKATHFPLTFGGLHIGGAADITSLTGNRTMSLHGLHVEDGLGLGGRAMREGRPRLTADYSRSRHITHDYDGEVMAECVKTLFAMPVIVDGVVRAVLYGGTRGESSPGTTFVQAGASVASALAREIKLEDEVTRRVAARRPGSDLLPSALLEELRVGHAELRRIAASVDDPGLRDQLLALEQRFARAGAPEEHLSQTPTVRLTPRELDVIAHAALGSTNLEIGASLSLTESTVKSYLKSAMSKLGASTRHAAVASARRARLIP